MESSQEKIVWSIVALFVTSFIIGLFWIVPSYNIWAREMAGKAELAEAEWSKKVQVEQAKANLEAEKLNAQSEIERAKGMAEAIRIEGGALTPTYIQYLWVRQNTFNDKTTIYIPTEANLPILEANRLQTQE
jgi:hypothetical protein